MALLAFIFILSGAAGLIYESVWARYVSLLVGHSAYAQVIVLVIFLGGMAIGSLAISKWSHRLRAPLVWYAVAEGAIALGGMVFHDVFLRATHLAYQRWLPALSPGFAATAVMWSISAALILPQSILLGATFPLMSAGAIRIFPRRAGASLGVLYFANSFGAAVGALVEGFVLIGAFGLEGTLHTAAALNAIVAVSIVGCVLYPRLIGDRPGSGHVARPAAPRGSIVGAMPMDIERVLLLVSFATAFSSFFYEIAWTRMLSLVHGSATHSFELMLSAFVLGIALGALWISRRADTSARPIVLLARLQWLMGIAAIATLPLYIMSFDWTASLLGALHDTDGSYRLYSLARYGMTLAIMLPATFCAGTTLPLITRILMGSGGGERAIGLVYGVNTIGSIVGVVLAALVLIPLIGLKWLLITGGIIDVGVGIALQVWIERDGERGTRRHLIPWLAGTVAIAVVVAIAVLSPFSPARLASGVYRYAFVPEPSLYKYLFYKDGRTASVSVRQATADTTGLLTISTNGKPDASVSPRWIAPYNDRDPKLPLDEDMSTEMFLPILTLVHSPGATVGAVIGQGSGVTSHMLLASPTLTMLHTIEIEPEMIRGSRIFYPGNRRVFDDPRSRFETDDARAFLASTGPRFDFVLSEPSNPWVSGVSSLFTVEFYERVLSRLQPTGILVQWFHLYEIDDATVSSVLASIDQVFPSYRVYLSSNSDIVIVAGAARQLASPDWSLLSSPMLKDDLRRFAPLSGDAFAAAELAERLTLHGYLLHATINSDFRPLLDLNGERTRFEKDFADGFRELAEMRLDIPAAIESRRRGFMTSGTNPTPEIFRAAALFRGKEIRDGLATHLLPQGAVNDSLRRAIARVDSFERDLGSMMPPSSWQHWLTEFINAEAELHGGTAGVADEDFFKRVRRYIEAVDAPAAVLNSVSFYHGLAAWDFAESARAGDILIEDLLIGKSWIPAEQLRLGTALSKIKLGDFDGARGVYTRLSRLDSEATLPDRVIFGLIEQGAGASVPPKRR